jgi:hypothetical protein
MFFPGHLKNNATSLPGGSGAGPGEESPPGVSCMRPRPRKHLPISKPSSARNRPSYGSVSPQSDSSQRPIPG